MGRKRKKKEKKTLRQNIIQNRDSSYREGETKKKNPEAPIARGGKHTNSRS